MPINLPGGGGTGGAWTLINSEILSADGTFDFQDIPASYNHLTGYAVLRSNAGFDADDVFFYLNNDTTAANYQHMRHVSGSAHSVDLAANPELTGGINGDNAPANYFATVRFLIPRYLGDHDKVVTVDTSRRELLGGTSYWIGYMIHWENTATIDRITLQPDGAPGDEFLSGSSLYLYGIT
jgi:hypothetical protein